MSKIHTRKAVIYLADDDPDDRELLLKAFLQITDTHQLKMASNGIALLDMLSHVDDSELPCLIVLDYNMHGLNGRDTLKFLQRFSRYQDIPKVIYTTSNSLLDKAELVTMGAKDFITKEATFQGILKSAKEMLTYSRQFLLRRV